MVDANSDEVTTTEQTTAFGSTFDERKRLQELFEKSPLPAEDLMFNLGMYARSSLLVKFLVMDFLYQRIKDLPGSLVEFGVWWGQNLVLMENLRAIHEPFNKQRLILGFDTFDGYPESKRQNESKSNSGFYQTSAGYSEYLATLMRTHEGNNAFGHLKDNFRLIKGDVTETAPKYFEEHPESLIALAFFDMGPYQPTIAALKAIKPHLLPGSVVLFDELTWAGAPGEAIAFKEAFKDVPFTIEKCPYYPSKSIVTVK